MNNFLTSLDDLAGIENEKGTSRWLDRIGFVFVILMAVSAPHSIAATQIAWVSGTLVLILRLIIGPRPTAGFRALDYALLAFFGWSVVSSLVSYEPAVSLDKLRGVVLFTVACLVIYNVRRIRAAYFLAFALILSCMVNVIMTPIQRIVGRGVEVHGLRPDGPLARAGFADGDTILKADGKKISGPAELVDALEKHETVKVSFHRPDIYETRDVKRADLLAGSDPAARLGFADWGPSHYWRVAGFFGHYTTYAEILQLIASLVFGLVVGLARRRTNTGEPDGPGFLRFARLPIMAIALGGILLALLMTATRASQGAFLVSAMVIILLTASRKFIVAAVLLAIPVALVGAMLLQQSRQIGFFDSQDLSTQYRVMMWRDGVRLWTDSPRNFVFGVGMDSVKEHWQEWGLYDKGWQPMGHFHSAPIQILVERGLPALLIWMAILLIYAWTLWRGIRANRSGNWRTLGILVGCLGGMIGFVTSGMVHWNLGDSEVAMVFFLLMGLSVRVAELSETEPEPADEIAERAEIRAAA